MPIKRGKRPVSDNSSGEVKQVQCEVEASDPNPIKKTKQDEQTVDDPAKEINLENAASSANAENGNNDGQEKVVQKKHIAPNSTLWKILETKFSCAEADNFYHKMLVENAGTDLKTVTITINSSVWQQTVNKMNLWQCQDAMVEAAMSAYQSFPLKYFKPWKFLTGPTFSGLIMFWKNENHYYRVLNNDRTRESIIEENKKFKEQEEKKQLEAESEKPVESGADEGDKEKDETENGKSSEQPPASGMQSSKKPPAKTKKPRDLSTVPSEKYTIRFFVDNKPFGKPCNFNDIDGLNLYKDTLARDYLEKNSKDYINYLAQRQMMAYQQAQAKQMQHVQTMMMQQKQMQQRGQMPQGQAGSGAGSGWEQFGNVTKITVTNQDGAEKVETSNSNPTDAANKGLLPENTCWDAKTLEELHPNYKEELQNPISQLNQFCQKNKVGLAFDVEKINEKEFNASMVLMGKIITGSGKNKKDAKQNCAFACLLTFGTKS